MKAAELGRAWSPARVALLLRNRLLEELPLAAIALGIALGLNLLSLVVSGRIVMNLGGGLASPAPAWGLGILLLGLWFAARSLSAMHGAGATDWLLLPATGTEKYSANLAWILVVWPLGAAAAAVALSAFLALLAGLVGARGGEVWHPFGPSGLDGLAFWWSTAPVFVAGSAFFRRHPLLKTSGVLVGTASAVAILVSALVFATGGWGGQSLSVVDGVISFRGHEVAQSLLQTLLDLWRYAILPVSALAFGWFRVLEKEAGDAVQ